MRVDCSFSDVLTLLIAIGWCLCHMMPGWAASIKRATASLAQSVGAAIAIPEETLIKRIRMCEVCMSAIPRVPALLLACACCSDSTGTASLAVQEDPSNATLANELLRTWDAGSLLGFSRHVSILRQCCGEVIGWLNATDCTRRSLGLRVVLHWTHESHWRAVLLRDAALADILAPALNSAAQHIALAASLKHTEAHQRQLSQLLLCIVQDALLHAADAGQPSAWKPTQLPAVIALCFAGPGLAPLLARWEATTASAIGDAMPAPDAHPVAHALLVLLTDAVNTLDASPAGSAVAAATAAEHGDSVAWYTHAGIGLWTCIAATDFWPALLPACLPALARLGAVDLTSDDAGLRMLCGIRGMADAGAPPARIFHALGILSLARYCGVTDQCIRYLQAREPAIVGVAVQASTVMLSTASSSVADSAPTRQQLLHGLFHRAAQAIARHEPAAVLQALCTLLVDAMRDNADLITLPSLSLPIHAAKARLSAVPMADMTDEQVELVRLLSPLVEMREGFMSRPST